MQPACLAAAGCGVTLSVGPSLQEDASMGHGGFAKWVVTAACLNFYIECHVLNISGPHHGGRHCTHMVHVLAINLREHSKGPRLKAGW